MCAGNANFTAVKIDIIQGGVISSTLFPLYLGLDAVHGKSFRTKLVSCPATPVRGIAYNVYSLLVEETALPWIRAEEVREPSGSPQ